MRLIVIFLVHLIVHDVVFAWQDDINVNLQDPLSQFSGATGFSYLSGAMAEIRLGRYLFADENHRWRGGVSGDVSLINFGPDLLWHMGLAIETLADDQNGIHFRLVGVYYQAMTGLKWRMNDNVFTFDYRHRCNHGADDAVPGRITIRSGLHLSYQRFWLIKKFRLDVDTGINLYILGQNNDVEHQPKGGAYLSVQGAWPLRGPVYMLLGAGFNLELVGAHSKNVYLISDRLQRAYAEPLFATRLALRIKKEKMTSDFALHFAQNFDTGLGPVSTKSHNLIFAIDFLW